MKLREVDLVNSDKRKKNLEVRSRVNLETRIYFNEKGYTEIETPVLTPDPEVSPIRPFIISNPEGYLRITDTEFLKRLVFSGFDKVYQLAKDFRLGDKSFKNNPEFTQLSISQKGIDYVGSVQIFKDYMIHIAKRINRTPVIDFFGKRMNLESDWVEITVKDALADCGIDLDKNLQNGDLERTAVSMGLTLSPQMKNYRAMIRYNLLMEEILDRFVIPKYEGKILFLKEFPWGLGGPGDIVNGSQYYKQRGEVYANCIEILNGSTIQRDPNAIREWYKIALDDQLASGLWQGKRLDEDYLRSASLFGVPLMVSMSLGYDRFVMMLTNSKDIEEVIAFPISFNGEK